MDNNILINGKRLPAPVNIRISYPKIQTHLIVTWDDVRDPNSDNLEGTFKCVAYNVYRGISAGGIFYKQNSAPLVTNRYEDGNVGKNPNTEYWYKVSSVIIYEEKDQNGKNKCVEGPLSPPVIYRVSNTNKWFAKINERNLWILKNTGQLFDLYTRKTEGEHCPKCYDPLRGRSGDINCDVCFGTGFVGGYEPMFQLYVRQKPAQTDLSIQTPGLVYNHTPGAWTISTVQIKNRDILINPQGIMFQVLSTQVNQAAGYLFHQEMQLKELDPNDPLYKIERKTLYPNL